MKRYFVSSGTATIAEFDTAEELNAWYDKQDDEGRHFCRLYDTVKDIDILGSLYMLLKPENRWADDSPSGGQAKGDIGMASVEEAIKRINERDGQRRPHECSKMKAALPYMKQVKGL